MHIVGLSIVLSCERLSVHNWQYSRLGFVLVLSCVCVRFHVVAGHRGEATGGAVKSTRTRIYPSIRDPVYALNFA